MGKARLALTSLGLEPSMLATTTLPPVCALWDSNPRMLGLFL